MTPKHKPVYRFQVVYSDKDKKQTLEIVDLFDETNPTMSVTNGIEIVLAEIFEQLGALPDRIIYQDTEGVWDQVIATSSGEFVRFATIQPRSNA